MGNIQTGGIYMQLGEYEKGYAQMHELETLLSEPPNNYMVPFVQCCFYTEAKEWDKFNSLIDEAMNRKNDLEKEITAQQKRWGVREESYKNQITSVRNIYLSLQDILGKQVIYNKNIDDE